MTTRVYEFAKKSGVPAKELLQILRNKGFKVGSHMAVLSPEALVFLKKQYPSLDKKSSSTVTSSQKKEAKVATPRGAAVSEDQQEEVGYVDLTPMTVDDLAKKVKKPITEVIVTLLHWGVVAAKNYVLTEDIVERLATHYGFQVKRPAHKEDASQHVSRQEAVEEGQESRLPIVAVLGHVDHGKTTLLDLIRKTKVAAKEKGGITQHLGAYEAMTPHGNIVFIDTPGHEAFSRLRSRGIRVADIVILVVAANDSVKPQSIEAIKQIESMSVPLVVAVNKMDVANEAQVEVVKRDLAQHGVLSEDWGGEVPIVPISAKTGKGVDNLLEVVSLQADILDLGAAPNVAGRCYVLETQFERGRGAVATLLCQHGSVSVGDYFVCGETSGRVSSIIDSRGRKLKKVGPSLPVQISGFDELAQAGDLFEIVSKQEYRKGGRVGAQRVPGVTPLLSQESVINILIKADTDSSRGALVESIQKLSKKLGNQLSIVQSAVGLVNESDISFASTTGSMVLAFHVKVEPKAVDLAKKLTVDIRSFDIIYKLLEDLEEYAQSKQKKEVVIKKVGEAEVLKVFDIKGFGKIAGSQVKSGHFVKKGTVVVYRDGEKIGEGTIKSLQREKKTVSEVKAGYECAFTVDSFDAWQEGDRVECYAQQ